MPTQKQLLAMFEYRDGEIYWIDVNRRGAPKNRPAGTDVHGYKRVRINNRQYSVHSVIWTMFMGVIPDGKEIDHTDQNSHDNRIEKLRLVTKSQNSRNKPLRKDNKSGYLGINKIRNRWRVTICDLPNRRVHLGSFLRLSDAIKARKRAELQHGYTKNHGKRKKVSSPIVTHNYPYKLSTAHFAN